MLSLDPDDQEVCARLTKGVLALVSGRLAVAEDREGTRVVYATEMHQAELRLAHRLGQLASAPARSLEGAARAIQEFEARAGVELAPEQRSAVDEAARRQVLVVTGGPGVGKTTIVRAILAVLARAKVDVRLAAPTGRAAKRMSEATGREAMTLHRLLEFEPKTASFKRNRHSPIEAGAVIVDEASMLDLAHGRRAHRRRSPPARASSSWATSISCPSVGPGAVLRDVIASGAVPCVRLRQIFRQAERSLIVQNAHRIHDGRAAPGARGGRERRLLRRRAPRSRARPRRPSSSW